MRGLAELYDVDELLHTAAPLLRAFVKPIDVISLRRSSDPTEIIPGLVLTPPEPYLEMWLLSQFDFLDDRNLRETGGFATMVDVRTTSRGGRWLSSHA